MINGPEAGVDMYFDKVEVSNYSRDRTWKSASDLRIEELRKNDVTFKEGAIDLKRLFMNPEEISKGRGQSEPKKIENPAVKRLEIKMIKNAFPFGAHINKDMMNDEYDRSNWPVLFNYGVAAVSHKTTLSATLGTTLGQLLKTNF